MFFLSQSQKERC